MQKQEMQVEADLHLISSSLADRGNHDDEEWMRMRRKISRDPIFSGKDVDC